MTIIFTSKPVEIRTKSDKRLTFGSFVSATYDQHLTLPLENEAACLATFTHLKNDTSHAAAVCPGEKAMRKASA
jgi:hypothetical protein